ncbi:MAG: hypothetical protein Q4P24_16600 [Rhodobacterales bacterium]|nr:hypothetical protein [Rhodobacterales bacterium]
MNERVTVRQVSVALMEQDGVQSHYACSGTDDQAFSEFLTDRFLVRTHLRVWILFIRERKNRNKRPVLIFILDHISPDVSSQQRALQETFGSVIPARGAILIFVENRQIGIVRVQLVIYRIPMAHHQIHERLSFAHALENEIVILSFAFLKNWHEFARHDQIGATGQGLKEAIQSFRVWNGPTLYAPQKAVNEIKVVLHHPLRHRSVHFLAFVILDNDLAA